MGLSAATIPTLSEVGTVASIAGAGIGALGAIQQGKAASASANYNAAVAANNAVLAKQNASFASQEGAAQAEAQSMKTRAEVGAIKANQGAAGVDVNSGSSLDVRSSAAETGELNALTIRSNAARQAYGYQTEATSATAQSQLDTAQAGFDTTAADIGASSTFLGGVGNATSNYAGFLNKNSFNPDPSAVASYNAHPDTEWQ